MSFSKTFVRVEGKQDLSNVIDGRKRFHQTNN